MGITIEAMELVTAVIKPHMLDSVKEALVDLKLNGMTVSEVKGFGRQGGQTETYRGTEYKLDFMPKTKIEIVVSDDMTQLVVDALVNGARTGKIGDGKVWVTPVSNVVRIRTNELNQDAI